MRPIKWPPTLRTQNEPWKSSELIASMSIITPDSKFNVAVFVEGTPGAAHLLPTHSECINLDEMGGSGS